MIASEEKTSAPSLKISPNHLLPELELFIDCHEADHDKNSNGPHTSAKSFSSGSIVVFPVASKLSATRPSVSVYFLLDPRNFSSISHRRSIDCP